MKIAKQADRYFFSILFIVLIIAGVIAAYFSIRTTSQQFKSSLLGRAASISAFVESEEIDVISKQPSNTESVAYKDLKSRIVQAAHVNTDVRYVYIMGRDDEGVFFFGDSVEPKDEANYSPPGARYDEASPELKAIFDNGEDLIEGPSKDSFGTWISGITPVLNQNGKVTAVVGIDIPYSKYQEEIIKNAVVPVAATSTLLIITWFGMRSRRRQQASFDLKAELVSIASHDLRSPLSGIEWAVKEVAENTPPKSQNNKLALAVAATVAELRSTVNTILQLAVEEKGIDTGLVREELLLRPLVEEVRTVFSLPAEAREVDIIVEDSVWNDVTIYVDKEKFKRALSNLVNNAVKYTNEGTRITVGYTMSPTEHVISVKDEGMGIPEADQKKVLAGFHRAANAARSGIEGTGLGMILTKRIIEAHGGELSFDSTENKGSTFYIHLPKSPVAK